MKIGHKDINPHVEFVAIQQEGIDDVFLHYDIIRIVELCKVVYDFYAPPTWFSNRLHDPVVQVSIHYLLFMEFYAELRELFGEVVCKRKKVKRNLQHLTEWI